MKEDRIHCRISAPLKKKVMKIAKAQGTTVTQMVEAYLRRVVAEDTRRRRDTQEDHGVPQV